LNNFLKRVLAIARLRRSIAGEGIINSDIILPSVVIVVVRESRSFSRSVIRGWSSSRSWRCFTFDTQVSIAVISTGAARTRFAVEVGLFTVVVSGRSVLNR
jgi:hypothetical protein